MSDHGICDCLTCVFYNGKKLVALEKAHAWFVANAHPRAHCDLVDDYERVLSEWKRARDLTL